jgi:glycosyltransferase involved in cell wall biosynthesis
MEALYHYTPIIVMPYYDFVKTFGKKINFGFYCKKNIPDEIQENIRKILTTPAYGALCISAHNAVKNHSWDSYISKMLKKIEGICNDPALEHLPTDPLRSAFR